MTESLQYTHTDDTPGEFNTGNKERWSDTVWNLSKRDIPFLASIKRKTIDSQKWEWYFEKLNAASATQADAKAQNFTPAATLVNRKQGFNYCMILQRAASVSDSAEKQFKVGIASEMRHQIYNHMVTLRQSVEVRALGGVRYRVPAAGTTAGLAMGFPGITGLFGDKVLHFNGSTPVYGVTNTTNIEKGEEDFEQVANTNYGYDKFKNRLQALWGLGARPTRMVVSAVDKAYVSLWDTSGVNRQSTKINEIDEMVDVVKTDFGNVFVFPDQQLTKDATPGSFDGSSGSMIMDWAILYDPKMLSVCMYRDFRTWKVAKTTSGETECCEVEFTFEDAAPHGTAIFNFSACSPNSPTVGLYTTTAGYSY
jgi:hypothetical protein